MTLRGTCACVAGARRVPVDRSHVVPCNYARCLTATRCIMGSVSCPRRAAATMAVLAQRVSSEGLHRMSFRDLHLRGCLASRLREQWPGGWRRGQFARQLRVERRGGRLLRCSRLCGMKQHLPRPSISPHYCGRPRADARIVTRHGSCSFTVDNPESGMVQCCTQ